MAFPKGTDTELLNRYLRDIRSCEPLSRKEEVELVRRIRAGDDEAMQKLVMANLRFVVSVARKYTGRGLSLIELIAEGNTGLLEAARRFDETRGFKFISYAVWWIRQHIFKALAEQCKMARPSLSRISDLSRIEKKMNRLTQELGREPTCEEVAASVDLSVERTDAALEVGQPDIALNGLLSPDAETVLLDILPSPEEGTDEIFERAERTAIIQHCMGVLDKRERRIVCAYFGLDGNEPVPLEKIGKGMGLTRERVRQLRDRALEKMRAYGGHILVEFSPN